MRFCYIVCLFILFEADDCVVYVSGSEYLGMSAYSYRASRIFNPIRAYVRSHPPGCDA